MKKNLKTILISVITFLSLSAITVYAALPVTQVINGGTGASTLTGCLQGNGTSPITGTGSSCGSGGSGVGTSTNPFMATYFVATSTKTSSVLPYASTTAITASTAIFGAGLTSCNSAANAVTWLNGVFGCNTISGSGTVNSGILGQFPYYASNGTALTATSSLSLDTAGNVSIIRTASSSVSTPSLLTVSGLTGNNIFQAVSFVNDTTDQPFGHFASGIGLDFYDTSTSSPPAAQIAAQVNANVGSTENIVLSSRIPGSNTNGLQTDATFLGDTGNENLGVSTACYSVANKGSGFQQLTGGDQLNDFATTKPCTTGPGFAVDFSQNQASFFPYINNTVGAYRVVSNFFGGIANDGVDARFSSVGTGLPKHFYYLNDNQAASTSAADATEVYDNESHSAGNSGSGGCYNQNYLPGGSVTTTPIDNNYNDACIVVVPPYSLPSDSAANFGTFTNPSTQYIQGFGNWTSNGGSLYGLDSYNYPVDYLDYGSSTSQVDFPYQTRDIGTPYQKAYIFTVTGVTNIPTSANTDLYSPDGTSSGRLYQVSSYSNTVSGGTGNIVFTGTSTPPASGTLTKIFSSQGSSDFTVAYSAVTLGPASMQFHNALSINETTGATTMGTTTVVNKLTLPFVNGTTQCLHADSSGNVTGTGSDCGSGGGGSSVGPINTLQASNGSGGFIATGTPQLTVGNLLATSTATSTFVGPVISPEYDIGGAVYNVKAYGAKGNNSTDDTASIYAAINAMPISGGELYFPPGTYIIGEPINVTKPMTIEGAGMAGTTSTSSLSTAAITALVMSTTTGTVFDVTATTTTFRNLSIINSNNSTKTAGNAIHVHAASPNIWQKVDYDSILTYGFYTDISSESGAYWVMNNVYIAAPTKYGLYIQDTNNQDAGDWSISNSSFVPSIGNPDAAIYIAGSGGGKIVNTKIVCADVGCPHSFVEGIVGNLTNMLPNFETSVLLISNDSIEGYGIAGNTGNGIDLSYYPNVTISNDEFGQYSNSGGSAIKLTGTTAVTISNDLFTGSSATNAIALTNAVDTHITNNSNSAFTNLYSNSGSTHTFIEDEPEMGANADNRTFVQPGNLSFTTDETLSNASTVGLVPSGTTFGSWNLQTSWLGNTFNTPLVLQGLGGSVGIATTTNSSFYKLLVNGNQYISDSLTAGKITATSSLILPSLTSQSCLGTNSSGVVGAGTCSGSGSVYPFFGAGNSTTTLTQFNGGLTALASSTIGDGSVKGGLTVNGNATTTGSLQVGLGATGAFSIDAVGHQMTGGSSPTCGTSCTTVIGDDNTMIMTTGISVSNATVNFANTWKNAAGTSISPVCIPTEGNGGTVAIDATTTPTTVTVTFLSALSTKNILIMCRGSLNATY